VAPTAPDQRPATNGNAWTSGKTGWQNHTTGSDPCRGNNSWFGVTCSGILGSANRNV
jgi:hypothetical protein